MLLEISGNATGRHFYQCVTDRTIYVGLRSKLPVKNIADCQRVPIASRNWFDLYPMDNAGNFRVRN